MIYNHKQQGKRFIPNEINVFFFKNNMTNKTQQQKCFFSLFYVTKQEQNKITIERKGFFTT